MDEMLELNFNLRIVQQLGYSIGVIFTMEICKDDPKTLLYTNRYTRMHAHIHVVCRSNTDICVFFPHGNWFIPVDHPSGTMPYKQGAMQTPFRKVYPYFSFSSLWLICL